MNMLGVVGELYAPIVNEGNVLRKRIYRISEDKFDDVKPNIEFEHEQIVESCYVSDTFKVDIDFKSTNDVKIRGVIYCDNPSPTISARYFAQI